MIGLSWTWLQWRTWRTSCDSFTSCFFTVVCHVILCLQLIWYIREAAMYVCILGKIIRDWYLSWSCSDHLKSKNAHSEASKSKALSTWSYFQAAVSDPYFPIDSSLVPSCCFPWLGTQIHPKPFQRLKANIVTIQPPMFLCPGSRERRSGSRFFAEKKQFLVRVFLATDEGEDVNVIRLMQVAN